MYIIILARYIMFLRYLYDCNMNNKFFFCLKLNITITHNYLESVDFLNSDV